MPLHDWSKMSTGHFHAFHTLWLSNISQRLNDGLLPPEFFALPEQHSEGFVTDISTYSSQSQKRAITKRDGAVALVEPRSQVKVVAQREVVYPGRRINIHWTGDERVVAVIELVFTGNKDRRESVGRFAGKVVDFLNAGVHVLVIDILPPNRSAPHGMHAAIWSIVEHRRIAASTVADHSLLVASYRAERKPIAYLNHASVGRPLPKGPLYLDSSRFVEVPLDSTYQETFDRLPKRLKTELR